MCTGINIDQNVAIDFQTHASRVQPSKARVGIMYGTIADDKRVHVEFVYEVGTFVDARDASIIIIGPSPCARHGCRYVPDPATEVLG